MKRLGPSDALFLYGESREMMMHVAGMMPFTPAPTALALMRSRYTAYVRGEIDYLAATQRAPLDRAGAAQWSRDTLDRKSVV